MNNKQSSVLRAGLLVCSALLGFWPAVARAQVAAKPADAAAKVAAADEETIVLSPFKVSTEKDKGYQATNSVSGSRLNTAIKEIPMPIEVITEKFLRDTGSNDLRMGLRYSAGILLQTQNDQGKPGGVAYQGPGGVNNPEGATANPNQTTIKIRGYITDTVLRDGFRRQAGTDTVNIARVEVVRGPAALLYGIGNFGGIVNYLPKTPESKARGEYTLSLGSNSFKRTSIDVTGPASNTWDLNYLVTAVYQDTKDYTQYKKESHNFISPVFSFKPTKTTEVIVDYEKGTQRQAGVGFKQIRGVAGVGINSDQNEHGGFVVFPGTNARTFRWSGPDTYYNSQADNLNLKLTQQLMENMVLLAGYNRSNNDFQSRDVQGNFISAIGPSSLRSTVILTGIDQVRGDSSGNVPFGPSPNQIFQYGWNDTDGKVARAQSRIELNYSFKLFEKSSKWLHINSSLLAGHSEERDGNVTRYTGALDNVFNFKSPADLTPLRFGKGTQDNGTAAGLAGDAAMLLKTRSDSTSWNRGDYFVYQGRFLNDRVTVVSGIRRDANNTNVTLNNYVAKTNTTSKSLVQVDRTPQNGVSIQITRALSIYALKAGGIQPNFDGRIDVNGTAMGPIQAKSKEVGMKIDLFNGKITGTISAYKIKRTGTPILYWWAPTTNRVTFDPKKPIVYQVPGDTLIPPGGSYAAAVAVGNATPGQGIWSVNGTQFANGSSTSGAAYLDAIFDYTKANGGWPGWFYSQTPGITNNSWNSIAGGSGPLEYVSAEDSSKGWDAQLMFSPTKNLQIIATYAHVTRVIDSAGQWAKYPYPEDRWAVWYFPNSDWGLANRPLATVYTDPKNTSSWTGVGFGSGERQDDTPEHQVSLFGNYSFSDGRLKGLTVGAGGYWESPREYMSGVTHGGGQFITDKNGKRLILSTASRHNLDLFIKYDFGFSNHAASVQLNVSNVLDDQKRYGFIYSDPRTMRLEFDYKF